MLDVDSAPSFLIEHKLIDHTWILDGHLTIRSFARRNWNLKVEGPGGTGFLIKQPGRSAGENRDTLQCEAAFHRFCREEPAMAPMARIVPRLVATDAEQMVLVFEAIPDAITLRLQIEADDCQGFTVEAARSLGHALGSVHRILSRTNWNHDPRLAWLSRALPWVMRLHKPWPALLASLSPATYQMLRVLQTQEGLREHFDALCRRWQPGTVIHGDIRFENVLVRPSRNVREPAPLELWIVDWEMVGIGDPAWDLAGALQDFLVFWVSSMPLSDELTAEQMISRARVPLSALRGAMRALWSGYRVGAEIETVEADGLLIRAVAFSALRLIQSVLELLDGTDRLAGAAVVLLQIAANLMAEPERGQVQLYGIPLG